MKTLDVTKYAIIYPRQSTADQVENNVYSLDTQMQLRGRALTDGFPEDNVLVIDDDLGVSGRTIAGRIGMTRALDLMNKGLVAVVYAEDMTRLTRDEDTVDHMLIGRYCKRAGCLLFMGGSWYDMNDAGQRQLFKYQAVGNSEQWAAVVQKMQVNKRAKAEDGKAVAAVPRGYRVNRAGSKRDPDRDRLLVHEEEAEVIRGIVARLAEAGSLTALYRLTHPTYWPDGTVVSFKSVRQFFANPIFRGVYTWGSVRVEGSHPAILSPDDVALVERLNRLNRATKRAGAPIDGALLAGLVWCPGCERRVYANSNNRSSSYRCQLPANQLTRDNHFDSHAGRIDGLVLADLWKRLDGGLIERIITMLERQRAVITTVQDAGEAQRRSIQKRLDGLLRTLGGELSDTARRMVTQQLNQAAAELEALNAQPSLSRHIDADLSAYQRLRADPEIEAIRATWDDEPLIWRRGWVRRFIDRVELTPVPGKVLLTVRYLDGHVSKLSVTRTSRPKGRALPWTPEETQALADLLARDDRPARGLYRWLSSEMETMGYKRGENAVFKVSKQFR